MARLKPILAPKLPSPLTWEDVEPALFLIDTVQELRAAAEAAAARPADGTVLEDNHEVGTVRRPLVLRGALLLLVVNGPGTCIARSSMPRPTACKSVTARIAMLSWRMAMHRRACDAMIVAAATPHASQRLASCHRQVACKNVVDA